MRSGQYILQMSGYKAFIASPLPPNPSGKMDWALQHLLSDADIALGRLDTMGYLLPNVDHILSIGILKETNSKKRDRRFSYWEYLDCLSEESHIDLT